MPEASFDALAGLLQHCEAVSRRMLEEAGSFYPFGAFVASDGTVAALGAYTGSDHPDPKEHFEFLLTLQRLPASPFAALGNPVLQQRNGRRYGQRGDDPSRPACPEPRGPVLSRRPQDQDRGAVQDRRDRDELGQPPRIVAPE